jgi:hypothetical protein
VQELSNLTGLTALNLLGPDERCAAGSEQHQRTHHPQALAASELC